MTEDIEQIWDRVKTHLRGAVDEATYSAWLEPLQASGFCERVLTISTPSRAHGWVTDRFGGLLQASVAAVLGEGLTVDVVTDGNSGRGTGQTQAARAHKPLQRIAKRVPLNPKLTFDQFVIGDSNWLAHAAALAVAEMPGHAYNPLFICGPPGVGKTHLLRSIAALLEDHNPDLSVRSTTGEAFTNEFVCAIAEGQMEAFKSAFRRCDVLLVDDVQFLEHKAKTEEEFFHTFNELYDSSGQIVLTSDRPPKDLQALEDRLRERFQAGLVADVEPPDITTRMTILRKRVHDDRVDLQDHDVIELLATRITNNVRELEGALIRVVAFSSLTGRAITAPLAEEVLDGLYGRTSRTANQHPPPTLADIQAAVCDQFHVSQDELTSSTRTARVAWPRQLAMYLSRELTSSSLPAIGREFGGRDHTTVLHACKRTRTRLTTDPTSRLAVDKVRVQLGLHPDDRPS